MKYSVCVMIPYSFDIEAETIEEFEQKLEYMIPANYGGDGIHVECKNGEEWNE